MIESTFQSRFNRCISKRASERFPRESRRKNGREKENETEREEKERERERKKGRGGEDLFGDTAWLIPSRKIETTEMYIKIKHRTPAHTCSEYPKHQKGRIAPP